MRWLVCVADHEYEIFSKYPFSIRRKGCDEPLTVTISNVGYEQVTLNGRTSPLHRVIALQFIENDDPEHKTQVDHIDRNKLNNQISNLRWTTPSENNENRKAFCLQDNEYLDVLPDSAVEVSEYKQWEFNRYWFDYQENRVIVHSRGRYKYVNVTANGAPPKFNMVDVNGKRHTLHWNSFYKEMMNRVE